MPLSATSAEGVVRSWTYDAVGNRLSETDGGVTTTFGYTPLGQVSTIAEANGAVTAFSYDASKGNLASVLSPLGHRTSWARDAAGRPVKMSEQITATDTTLTQTFYDVMGRDTLQLRTSSVDANWAKVRTEYDPVTKDRVRVTPWTNNVAVPGGADRTRGVSAWTYDQLGRVVTWTSEAQGGPDSLVYPLSRPPFAL